MRKRRQRIALNRFDFSQLEDRQLLAGDVVDLNLLQVATDLPTATNLIANGDFESFNRTGSETVVNGNATAGFFPGDNVTGWSVSDGDGDGSQRINLLTFGNARATVLDLDSLPNQNDRVFQDVLVEVNQDYVLAFDFRNQPRLTGDSTDDFEVYFDGNLVGSYTGGDLWNTGSVVVSAELVGSSTSRLARLEFRNVGDGDGRGALVDCVRLVAVTSSAIGNGGFELVNSSTTGPAYQPADVENWDVYTFPDDTEDRVIRVAEHLSGEPGGDGSNYLSLNSSTTALDQVFQDLDTVVGATYYVKFDLRQDPSVAAAADQLRVRWADAWAATFVGVDSWQSYGILLEADSDSTRLTFREPGENLGNGASPQIDNVRVLRVNQIVNDLAVDADVAADGSNSSVEFVEGSAATSVAPALGVNHESGRQLTFAQVALLGDPATAEESLAVDVGSLGLTAQYNSTTGRLALQGAATIAEYQTVLRTLTYQNTSESFASDSRLIGISVTDSSIAEGDNFSSQAVITVALTNVNDLPALAAISDVTVDFGETAVVDLMGSDIEDGAVTYAISATGLPSGIAQPTVSNSGQVTWTPGTSGTFELTATATDSNNETVEQKFDVTIGNFTQFEGVGALSSIPVLERNAIYTGAPPFNIDTANTYDAVIDTNRGEIRIRLLDDASPTFVNNFVNLVRDGYYDGLVFHRVIDGFVAQGGDPLGTSTSTVSGEAPGQGGPGYQIPDETANTLPFDSRGQLAFANRGSGTTGSQFFLTFDATGLSTSQFSVFGNVTSGDAVLDLLTRTTVGNNTPIPGAVPDVINSITIIETPASV